MKNKLKETPAYKNLYIKYWYLAMMSENIIVERSKKVEKILKLTDKEKKKLYKARNPFEDLEIPEIEVPDFEEIEIPDLEDF